MSDTNNLNSNICEPDVVISGESTTSPLIEVSEFKTCTDFRFGPDTENYYAERRPILTIDKAYFFKFHSDISKLDDLYTVKGIFSYSEIDNMVTDPVGHLYNAVGKPAHQKYVAELKMFDFRYQVHYKLSLVTDPTVVYFVPESLITVFPADDYKPYKRFMFSVDVGVIPYKEELQVMMDKIKKMVDGELGIKSQIALSSYGTSWLNEEQIEHYNRARALLVDKKIYSLDTNKLQVLNDQLSQKLALYEEYIIDIFNTYRDFICQKQICEPDVFIDGETTTTPVIKTTPFMICKSDELQNATIITPTIVSPINNSTSTGTSITAEISSMKSIPDNILGYGGTIWQLAKSSTFEQSSIISEITTDSLKNQFINLLPNTTYWVRGKHMDFTKKVYSVFSMASRFTTASEGVKVITTPSIIEPNENASFSRTANITFRSSVFDVSPKDSLVRTEVVWQISDNLSFSGDLIKSITNNMNTWTVNDFVSGKPYYIRIKHLSGSIGSEWSNTLKFNIT